MPQRSCFFFCFFLSPSIINFNIVSYFWACASLLWHFATGGIEHKATRAGFSVLYCTNKVSIRLWMWIYATSAMSWIFLFDSDRYCAFETRQIAWWMSTFAWLHLQIEKHGWLQGDITKSLELSLLKCHWIPRGFEIIDWFHHKFFFEGWKNVLFITGGSILDFQGKSQCESESWWILFLNKTHHFLQI